MMTSTVTDLNVALNMARATCDGFPEYALPQGYRFRTYRPGDAQTWTDLQLAAEPFVEVTDQLFPKQFGDALDALPDRMFFVESDGSVDGVVEPVGSITAWWESNRENPNERGRIHWVVIHPNHQRRGLCKPMMTHAMHRMAQSYDRAMLDTASGRPWAVKVYLDFGFVPEPTDLANPENRAGWMAVQSVIHHPVLAQVLSPAA